ncbi:hypothetical protein NQ317_008096 [Molorchus minor]|uniref:Sorting nexin C-terminal domain-containing protein n=1 Tax=Molorchus minor TaxID=1323400 RepID=A0ABQ9JE12_9CUCU|nr:hypothetical protein NQ317_008096 [Molorchus minor]
MPEQFINTVDEVVVGLTKVFHTKPGRLPEASKVGASIEESDDNIPLRIIQAFWPNGVRSEKKPERDDDMKNRTRVAAKVALLSCLSDELQYTLLALKHKRILNSFDITVPKTNL